MLRDRREPFKIGHHLGHENGATVQPDDASVAVDQERTGDFEVFVSIEQIAVEEVVGSDHFVIG